jgi:hypothetical protein
MNMHAQLRLVAFKLALTSVFSLGLSMGLAAGAAEDGAQLYTQGRYAEAVRAFEARYNESMAYPNSAYYYALSLVAAGNIMW